MLRLHGIEPAPERSRRTIWREFLSRHWGLIVAADFFTVEVWTRRGLKRFVVLFFMELSTRKVEIAGIASAASGLWMSQIGRNLTDATDGMLNGKRYLIHDRDPLFTAEFLALARRQRGGEIGEIAAALAKFECPRGTVRAHDQGIVSGPDGPVWRGSASDSDF
jgi:hypothetical protein